MRLFVAAEIGDTVASRLAELSRELQQRVIDAVSQAKVTWIPVERLHLTIRFIGEVDDMREAAIREVLTPPLELAPFDMTLHGVGAFPKGGSPRVLWVGVTRGREELMAVESEISARLEASGVPPEERPYSPHLTLARVREPAGLRSARLLDGLADRHVGSVQVDAITLFQSKLSPKGPTYMPLLRIPLRAG